MVYDLFLAAVDNSRTDSFDSGVGIGFAFCIFELLEINRFADVHVYRMTVDKGFSFRQDLKASIQGKRNNRQAEVHGNLKSAAFEPSHFAVKNVFLPGR